VERHKLSTPVKRLIGAAVVVAAALLLWWASGGQLWGELFSDREKFRQTVSSAGALAPAVFVLLLIVQAVLAPLPAPALAAAGGYMFGPFNGFILTWLGTLAGGVLCFALSRILGRRFVERNTRFERLNRYVEEHGAIVIFILRLIPVISFDAINYAAGLTGISFWRFLIATALGMAPGTFIFVYLGGTDPGPGIYAALGGLAALAAAAYVYYHRLQRVEGR